MLMKAPLLKTFHLVCTYWPTFGAVPRKQQQRTFRKQCHISCVPLIFKLTDIVTVSDGNPCWHCCMLNAYNEKHTCSFSPKKNESHARESQCHTLIKSRLFSINRLFILTQERKEAKAFSQVCSTHVGLKPRLSVFMKALETTIWAKWRWVI